VREADAALKEARFVLDTTAKLQRDGVVSRIDYEKANVRMQGIEARYQAAIQEVLQSRSLLSERRAQLALARQNLADTTIRAPFSGAITRRQASLGEFLPVNAAVVTLVRQHPLRVRLEVPERYAPRVKMGQKIDVTLQGATLPTPGRVVRLSPAIEAQSRALLVEGEIPNPDGKLRPGSFVEGAITVDQAAVGFAVPSEAVTSFAGVERVFVVSGGVLEERIVRSGRKLVGGRVQILEGLHENESVVAAASDRMFKGQSVRVQ
jgi:HlyD family secretion protein